MTTLDNVTDPAAALALAILRRAKMDAQRGNLDALAWLIVAGVDIADALAAGAGAGVLRFARETLRQVDAGQVAAQWGVE